MSEFNELFDDHLFDIDEVKEKTVKLKEGERRMVSILFADVKGFTSLSEKLDHEEVQTLMDHIMKIFTHSVEMHGGYVDKYTGDQIMALYGAKVASEVDTERALSTGLDMLVKLSKFNLIASKSDKFKKHNINFSIRVGVHTGMVTTGKIGKEREGDYTVYGDAVNLASRMESNAPVNSIMIPEYTMNLVRKSFVFKDNGAIEVKGKKEPVSVYLVETKRDKEVSHNSPFVGRDTELLELSRIYTNCNKYLKVGLTEKLSLIGVHAEAGVGKSRLIHEFLNKSINLDLDYFSMGSCSNISSQPYHLFTTLIKDSFKISIIDNDAISREKFESNISSLIKINPDKKDRIERAKPFLGFLIGLKYNDPRLKDKKELVNHFKISIRVFLEVLCKKSNDNEKAFIILFEDLHWIDKMSLETLEYILNTFNIQDKRNKDKVSVPMFICTYRNEYIPENSIKNNCKFYDMDIENLDNDSSVELIEILTKNINLDKNKISELYVKSNGNPFFIEEWVNLLKDSKSSDSIDASRDRTVEYSIPNTLNSLILSRIDTLEKDLKLLLQKATIIGEDFFIKILSLLEKKLGSNENILNPVHDLESENFIHHYLKQIDHYRFKHILTRDVAYSTILKSNKKILHNAVGDVIEENFQDIIEKFYYDLAIHYDSCEDFEKAIIYLVKAGNKFNELVDKRSALKCYKRVLDIIKKNKIEDPKTLHRCKIDCAEIYTFQGKTDKSIKIINSLLKDSLTKENEARTKYISGITNLVIRENKTSLQNFTEALKLYSHLKDLDTVADINLRIGLLYINIGNFDKSMEFMKKSLDHYKQEKNILEIGSTYGSIANIYMFQGKFDKAYEIFGKQYEISKKLDSRLNIQTSLGNMALIDNIQGKYTLALNKFNEILINAQDIDDRINICKTYGNIGIAYKNLNDYEEAIENFTKQLEISQESNFKGQETFTYINMGVVFHKKGELDESFNYYNLAEKSINEIEDINAKSLLYGNRGNLLLDKGDFDNAIIQYENSIKIFTKLDNFRGVCLAKLKIAEINLITNKLKVAEETISEIYPYFKKINDLPYYTLSLILKSKIKRRIDNYKDAKDSIDEAFEVSKSLNSAEISNTITIEKLLIKFISKNSNELINKLLIVSKQNISNEHKAYIHYNIWKNTSDDESKLISLKLYKNEFKKYPKYQYTIFIDEMS